MRYYSVAFIVHCWRQIISSSFEVMSNHASVFRTGRRHIAILKSTSNRYQWILSPAVCVAYCKPGHTCVVFYWDHVRCWPCWCNRRSGWIQATIHSSRTPDTLLSRRNPDVWRTDWPRWHNCLPMPSDRRDRIKGGRWEYWRLRSILLLRSASYGDMIASLLLTQLNKSKM